MTNRKTSTFDNAAALRACADLLVMLEVAPGAVDFEVRRRALRATLEVLHEIQNDVVAMLAPTSGTIANLSDFPEDLDVHADPHGKPS